MLAPVRCQPVDDARLFPWRGVQVASLGAAYSVSAIAAGRDYALVATEEGHIVRFK